MKCRADGKRRQWTTVRRAQWTRARRQAQATMTLTVGSSGNGAAVTNGARLCVAQGRNGGNWRGLTAGAT